MKIRQLAAMLVASLSYCSIATAATEFVTIDTIHSRDGRMEITSLTPTSGRSDDRRAIEFRGIHLSYDNDKYQRQPLNVNLDLSEIDEDQYQQLLDITNADEVERLFDQEGQFRITRFVDADNDINIQAAVMLRGIELDSYGQTNKTILALELGSGNTLSTVIVTDDPVPILIPAIVGIVSVTVAHYLSCSSGSLIDIKMFPKLWGGIEIKAECG